MESVGKEGRGGAARRGARPCMGKGTRPTSFHSVGPSRALALGAYCLDGTVPGFWYQAANSAATARSWLIFLDGGAWCYDQHSCESRARGFKGSTSSAPKSFWPYAGPMDENDAVNPGFASFHRLHLHYCDGASFAGDRATPITIADGKLLYLRGRRVFAAQIAAALELGLQDADEVLFAGGSAGGIAAMHAAPWLRAELPRARRFKVMILSGYFLEQRSARSRNSRRGALGSTGSSAAPVASDSGRASPEPGPEAAPDTGTDIRLGRRLSSSSSSEHAADDAPECRRGHASSTTCMPWVSKMRHMCELHNCTGALLEGGCGHDLPEAQRWRCLFGRHAAAALRVPVFVINSAIDAWQMVNVWRRFARCRWDGAAGCSSEQAIDCVIASDGE